MLCVALATLVLDVPYWSFGLPMV